jgi:hypothetical protein
MSMLREVLWSFGLLPVSRCPNCGGSLTEHGFVGHNRRYECSNAVCGFVASDGCAD